MRRLIATSPLLRLALRLDAVVSLAAGALTCTLASRLAAEFGAPAAVILGIGLFMLGYGVLAGVLGSRPELPRWIVLFVVIGNTVWALDSLLLFTTGWISPSMLGIALIVAQALVVGALATLQGVGLRRSERLPA